MLSKLKNSPSFLHATIGFYDLYNRMFSQKFSRKDFSKKINDTISEIRLNGCCVIECAIPNDLCDQLVTAHKRIGEYTDITYKNDRRTWGIHNISDIHRDYLKYYEDHLDGKSLGEKYCGSQLKLSTLLAGRLSADCVEPGGSGAGWHRDSFTQQFKSILYLTDVTEKNGPFQYIKGSHLRSNIRKVLRMRNLKHEQKRLTRYTNEDIDLILEELDSTVTTLTGKKGSILFADTRGIHQGSPILECERFSLTTYYTADNVQITDEMTALNNYTINKASMFGMQRQLDSRSLDKYISMES